MQDSSLIRTSPPPVYKSRVNFNTNKVLGSSKPRVRNPYPTLSSLGVEITHITHFENRKEVTYESSGAGTSTSAKMEGRPTCRWPCSIFCYRCPISRTCFSYISSILYILLVYILVSIDLNLQNYYKILDENDSKITLRSSSQSSIFNQTKIDNLLKNTKNNQNLQDLFSTSKCHQKCLENFPQVLEHFPRNEFENRLKLRDLVSSEQLFHKWGQGYAELVVFGDSHIPPIYEALGWPQLFMK